MYLPKVFENNDSKALFDLIEQWSFGELITTYDNELFVNHMLFIVDQQKHKLYGHLAAKNPQIDLLEKADELIVIFKGADAYVSPSWYSSEEMVPTWNYETVHAKGKASLLNEDGLVMILEKLTQQHEQQFANQWNINKVSEPKLHKMMQVITGFEIDISSIEGKRKLSQNRSLEDRLGVISGLRTQADTMSQIIADKMASNL